MKFNHLTPQEKNIIENKSTERPFTGEYDNFYKPGMYVCRRCNNPLYSAKAKFDAGCGWPAFDDHFPGSVKEITDMNETRIEIQCTKCGGHLGHIFKGEGFTKKNVRECVNSLSIKFVPDEKIESL